MDKVIGRIAASISTLGGNSTVAQIGVVLGAVISNLFLPIAPVILTCFGLTIVDLFYGLKVANRKKVRIESKRTWNGTIRKMRDTFTIITMIRCIELYLLCGITDTLLVGSAATIIGLTEVWSILENMNTLNPKGPWRALSKFMTIKGSEVTGVDLKDIKDECSKTTE